jgi:hypothetical protein
MLENTPLAYKTKGLKSKYLTNYFLKKMLLKIINKNKS